MRLVVALAKGASTLGHLDAVSLARGYRRRREDRGGCGLKVQSRESSNAVYSSCGKQLLALGIRGRNDVFPTETSTTTVMLLLLVAIMFIH